MTDLDQVLSRSIWRMTSLAWTLGVCCGWFICRLINA